MHPLRVARAHERDLPMVQARVCAAATGAWPMTADTEFNSASAEHYTPAWAIERQAGGSSTRDNAVLYCGPNTDEFVRVFSEHGMIWRPL